MHYQHSSTHARSFVRSGARPGPPLSLAARAAAGTRASACGRWPGGRAPAGGRGGDTRPRPGAPGKGPGDRPRRRAGRRRAGGRPPRGGSLSGGAARSGWSPRPGRSVPRRASTRTCETAGLPSGEAACTCPRRGCGTRPIGVSIVNSSRAGMPLTSARYSFSTRPARHAAATARRAPSVRAKRTRPDVPRPSRCIGTASGWRQRTRTSSVCSRKPPFGTDGRPRGLATARRCASRCRIAKPSGTASSSHGGRFHTSVCPGRSTSVARATPPSRRTSPDAIRSRQVASGEWR